MPQDPKTKKPAKIKAARKKSGAKKTSKIDLEDVISDVISETEVAVNAKKQKSSHIVNLKNPEEGFFNNEAPLAFRPEQKKPASIKPPKDIPKVKRGGNVGVNFVSQKSFNPVKIFFKIISSPFKIFVGKTRDYDYSNHEQVQEKESRKTFGDHSGVEDIFAPPKKEKSVSFKKPKSWRRKLAFFVVMLLIFILPLQAFTYYQDLQNTRDKVLLATNEAIESLRMGEQAATLFDLSQASANFENAQLNFVLAQNEVNALNKLTTELLKLMPEKNRSVQAGVTLLEVGELAAATGQILIDASQEFLADGGVNDYYNSLVNFENKLRLAFDNYRQIKEKINSINPADLPEEHRADFIKVAGELPKIENGLKNILAINNSLLTILGQNQWQRYLFIFMNNNELRATGGFMGSFALVDVDRGEIKNLEVPGGGTYDIQGQLKPKVIAPEALHLINPRWEFQDSNWWPDFPTAAPKIAWFQENADGPSVDGVVAITATLLERLLVVFGPIDMPEYDTVITSENFRTEAQTYSALEYDKQENQPKKLIADMAPKLIDKIFNAEKEQFKELFEILRNGLNEKHLLVYFTRDSVQEIVSDFGWDGKIKQTGGDYLSIVHSNIAGGKTDEVINEIINHQAEIQEDGSIINTIKLVRQHNGVRGENIFTGVQNNSYVRFYVPQGSTLLEASGFEKPPENLFEAPPEDYVVDEDMKKVETNKTFDEETGTAIHDESGKTVFGNWLQLQPGETQEIVIKYKLPFKLIPEAGNKFFYSLLAQKQHGSLGSELRSSLILNDQLELLDKFPADLPSDENNVSFNTRLITDQFYGVTLIEKQ